MNLIKLKLFIMLVTNCCSDFIGSILLIDEFAIMLFLNNNLPITNFILFIKFFILIKKLNKLPIAVYFNISKTDKSPTLL